MRSLLSKSGIIRKPAFGNFFLNTFSIGGVLEDVLGLEDVLENTFWNPWPWRSSPWPWPRSLKSSKIALSSARGLHNFLNLKNFVVRLKNVFDDLSFWRSPEKKIWSFLLENVWKIFLKTFFRRTLAPVSLVLCLGLEHSCPRPWESLSRKGCPWPWSRIFLWSWPWALCPRLHLWH